ncbi:uncharacterized protein LOC144027397 isoform X2 [Festucalex cinctus]
MHQVVLVENPEVGASEWQEEVKKVKVEEEECLQSTSLIKMEEENIPSCQDGEQLTGQEMVEVAINDVQLKDEDPSSQFHHSQGEVVGQYCEESDNIAPLSDMVSPETNSPGVPLENSHPANSSPPSFPQRGKAFDNMRNSRQRTKRRASSADAQFSCAMCNKAFTLKSNLTIHLKTHMNVRPFVCPMCGNAFTRRHHLKRHLNSHASGRRVPGRCEKTSPFGAVSTHAEHPISCLFCAKGFTKRSRLERHMTTHTGEKPFSCDVCDKRFTRKEGIRKHKCVS